MEASGDEQYNALPTKNRNSSHYHALLYSPNILDIFHATTHPHSASFPIPFHYQSSLKRSIRVNSSHHLFPSSRTCSPPALDVIIFTQSFHRHYTLFHRKRSRIDLTKTKSTRRVRYCITGHKNYLIRMFLTGFGILTILSRHFNNFNSRLIAFKSPWKFSAKSIRNTRPRCSSIIGLGVSRTTRPLPLRVSSIIVTLSSFRPSPQAIPCFEKHLRKLWKVLGLFHGVSRSFHRL